jgi:hypothetical protein
MVIIPFPVYSAGSSEAGENEGRPPSHVDLSYFFTQLFHVYEIKR